jgi:hypothetical protein
MLFPAIEFAVPRAGSYVIAADFAGIHKRLSTTDVHVHQPREDQPNGCHNIYLYVDVRAHDDGTVAGQRKLLGGVGSDVRRYG